MLTRTLGTDEQRELSFRILEGTSRIEHMVEALRRYAQPVEPVLRAVVVDELVNGLRSFLAPETWKQVDVTVDPAVPETVPADPMLLRQALLALLQNAVEANAAQDSGVQLSVGYDAAADTVTFQTWNDGALDMPAEQVFEPFVSSKPPQLGLGLALARRIARAHRGALVLTAADAEAGTEFTLQVPATVEVAEKRLSLE